jgi:hypothetical protein
LRARNEFEDAKELYDRSLKIFIKHYGEENIETYTVYGHLGYMVDY